MIDSRIASRVAAVGFLVAYIIKVGSRQKVLDYVSRDRIAHLLEVLESDVPKEELSSKPFTKILVITFQL